MKTEKQRKREFKTFLERMADKGIITKREARYYAKVYCNDNDRFKNTDKYSVSHLKKMIIKEMRNRKTKTVHPSSLVKKFKVSGYKINVALRILENEGKIIFR